TYSSDSWQTSGGCDRYRRGLYTFLRRTAPYPTFVTFDATSHEVACPRRARTNTPLQALATLNDPAFVECATALAGRMIAEGGGRAARDARGARVPPLPRARAGGGRARGARPALRGRARGLRRAASGRGDARRREGARAFARPDRARGLDGRGERAPQPRRDA